MSTPTVPIKKLGQGTDAVSKAMSSATSSYLGMIGIVAAVSVIAMTISAVALGLQTSTRAPVSYVSGLYTSVLGSVIDIVPSSLVIDVQTGMGMLGGQPVSPGQTINLRLADAQTFTMLSVSDSSMLGPNTSCVRPLLPSCYDISNQGCTSPVLMSCIPQDQILNSLTVNRLTVINATQLDVSIGNQTVLFTEQLFVTGSSHFGGQLTCAPNATMDNGCLNLGGYSCPSGIPFAESCIPASLILVDASVTNTLTVNQVVCSGGPLPDACVSSLLSTIALLTARVTELESKTPDLLTSYQLGSFSSTHVGNPINTTIPYSGVTGPNVVLTNRTINSLTWTATNPFDAFAIPVWDLILREDGVPVLVFPIVPGDWTTTSGTYISPGWGGFLSKTFPDFIMQPGRTYSLAYRTFQTNFNRIAGTITFFKAP